MFRMSSSAGSIAPAQLDRAMPLSPAQPFTTSRRPHERSETALGGVERWPTGGLNPASRLAVDIWPPEGINRRAIAWDGMAVETVNLTRHGRIRTHFQAPLHLLALFEAGSRADGETFVEGLPRSALRNYKRKFIFVPADHEYVDWQETSSLPRMAFFYFDPAAFPLEGGRASADRSLSPQLFFEDAALWDTAVKLKTLLDSARSCDRGYCEALGAVLAHELVRFTSGSRRLERPVRGGLAAWQQRLVTNHIEEHLTEQISLAELGQLVRLSPYHFCRAFKQSFGTPPHRFHLRRRIERAKELLANRTLSVTDVGFAIGFSGTSAFTMSFRKVSGMTPTEYRRSVT